MIIVKLVCSLDLYCSNGAACKAPFGLSSKSVLCATEHEAKERARADGWVFANGDATCPWCVHPVEFLETEFVL